MEIQIPLSPELNPPLHKSVVPPAASKPSVFNKKRIHYKSGQEKSPNSK
jgi:hypothetical protein